MSCGKCTVEQPAHIQADNTNVNAGGEPTILLVGNPNVGKSTLFNTLTGARQAVVNAPGTTVEVMRGRWSALGARILDLPGTYSLIANSPDEQVVVDTLAGVPGSFTDPAKGLGVDLVIVLLDATSISRSLYLLGQVAKTGRPVAAVVTLGDVVEHDGGERVDTSALAHALGIPVMAIDPRSKKGIEGLDDMVKAALITRPRVANVQPDPTAPGYSKLAAQGALAQAEQEQNCGCNSGVVGNDMLTHSTKDSNKCCQGGVSQQCCTENAPDSTASAVAALDNPALRAADDIFTWVDEIQTRALGAQKHSKQLSQSDKIDQLLLHPIIGIPVFFALMWLLFKAAAEWVGPLQELFDGLFTSSDEGAFSVANLLGGLFAATGLGGGWVEKLVINGLVTGLGVVASFLPLMFVIFLMIAILEDSGYMARAAFLGDRIMRWIGLDGRVIMPLIMGFGCNLPSLAATRTLPSAKQRLVTTLIIPYTSCAARLSIYLMIARIFFPENAGTVIFGMYVASILMVVLGALALKPFFTKNEAQAPLMLVLPPYQMPRVLVIVKNTWMRSWSFVQGAGKIIVVMTIIVWLMSAIPVSSGHSFAEDDLPMENSLYGATAMALEPVFAPAGFGEWHMTGALMTGFVAKETVISSVVVSYNLDPETDGGDAEEGGDDLGSLPELVSQSFQESAGDAAPLAALAFLFFVLTYTPCLATVAEQARQIGGKLTAIAVVVQLVAAWLLATGIYQIGRLFW